MERGSSEVEYRILGEQDWWDEMDWWNKLEFLSVVVGIIVGTLGAIVYGIWPAETEALLEAALQLLGGS